MVSILRFDLVAGAALVAALAGCGSAAFQSQDVRVTLGETKYILLDSGVIIVGKKEVGALREDGKIVDTRGKLLLWVHESNIRVRGGTINIYTDPDGTVHLSVKDQEAAGLRAMKRRLRANGRLIQSENSAGIQVSGALTDARRRALLAILLASENGLWEK